MAVSGRPVLQRRDERVSWIQRVLSSGMPIDPFLAVAAIALSVMSVLAVRDATGAGSLAVRQAIYAIIGVGVAFAVSRMDYTRLRDLRWVLWGVMLASILAVAALGSSVNGATLSIQLPGFSFQASELGKVLLAVSGAAFVVERSREVDRWRTTLLILAFMLLPAVMVSSGDFGSGMVYAAVTLGVLLIGGTPGRHLAVLGVAAVVLVGGVVGVAPAVLGHPVLKQYQQDRLTAFLSPNEQRDVEPGQIDPRYQLQQAKIAIGSGRKTGRGSAATQAKLGYVPEKSTDFALASIGERWGFVGAVVILSLYALIMWRGLHILSTSKDFFGAVVAAGILAMLLCEVLVNAGMNVGIMPITGIPLPLVSYGGSSVLSTYLALGLLQAIYARGRVAARRGPTVARTD